MNQYFEFMINLHAGGRPAKRTMKMFLPCIVEAKASGMSSLAGDRMQGAGNGNNNLPLTLSLPVIPDSRDGG